MAGRCGAIGGDAPGRVLPRAKPPVPPERPPTTETSTLLVLHCTVQLIGGALFGGFPDFEPRRPHVCSTNVMNYVLQDVCTCMKGKGRTGTGLAFAALCCFVGAKVNELLVT